MVAVPVLREPLSRRIADALQLSSDDRAYLLSLGDDAVLGESVSSAPPENADRFLDHLLPWAAYIRDAGWNVVAWNRAAQTLFDFDGYAGPQPQNFVRRFFADATYRTLYGSWDTTADQIVARLRSAYAVSGPELLAVVDELRAQNEEFARRWDPAVVVQSDAACAAEFRHASVGTLTCDVVLFAVVGSAGYVVVTLVPTLATGTAEKLQQMDLAARGAELTPAG